MNNQQHKNLTSPSIWARQQKGNISSQNTNVYHTVVQFSQMFANIKHSKLSSMNICLMFVRTVLSVENVCVWLGCWQDSSVGGTLDSQLLSPTFDSSF